MKRKSTLSSDEDSDVSEDVEFDDSDEMVSEDEADHSDGNDDDDEGEHDVEVDSMSDDIVSVKSIESEQSNLLDDVIALEPQGVEADREDKEDKEDRDDLSVVSADENSDDDSVSLNSMDTTEAESAAHQQKEEAEALRDRDFSSLYLPVGGIFDHKLIRGLPVDPEEFKKQQQAFFNGETAAERTTTRNTPANVIEALDQELRFARPPVTSDILVAKYNVIKLVIKRRIDHLRSRGFSTPGIRYDHSLSTTSYEESSTNNNDEHDRLLYDIQFRNPPLTVKDMSALYNLSVHALHAKIYALRNKGVVTNGICASTNGRGRPRKVENESIECTESNNNNTHYPAYRQNKSNSNSSRVLKYFTEEDDNYLTSTVLKCLEQGTRVNWGEIDAYLNRTRGAAKQRWHKTIERKVGDKIQSCLSKNLHALYQKYEDIQPVNSNNFTESAVDHDGEDGSDTGISKAVKGVLSSVVSAVEVFSHSFPHHTVTLPLALTNGSNNSSEVNVYNPTNNTTSTTATANGTTTLSSHTKSNRTIIPTPAALQQHLHTSGHNGQRRAFTEQEDILIISTALLNRQRGTGRFWNALDEQLQRPKLAARGRWQRVLEPIVDLRIAMMTENKGIATVGGVVSNGSTGSSSSSSSRVTANIGASVDLGNHSSSVGGDNGQEGQDSLHTMNGDAGVTGSVGTDNADEGDNSNSMDMDVVEQTAVEGMDCSSVDKEAQSAGSIAVEAITVKSEDDPTASGIHDDGDTRADNVAIKSEDATFGTTTNIAATTSSSSGTTSQSNSFTTEEDNLIRSTVANWTDAGGNLHELNWRQLDAQLKRPIYAALVRYLTVLQPSSHTSTSSTMNGSTYSTSLGTTLSTKTSTDAPAPYSLMSLYNKYCAAMPSTANPTDIPFIVRSTLGYMVVAVIQHSELQKPKKVKNNAVVKDEVNHNRCKRFSQEEDDFVKKWIEDAKAAGKNINWSELDKALNRSTGATRQRWKKVLGNEY